MEWIGAVIALLAAGAAFWQAAEARKARTGADTSNRSAQDAATRIAAAVEEQAAIAREAASAYQDPWSWQHRALAHGGHKWTFFLNGSEVAHDIEWDVEPTERNFAAAEPLPTEMHPGESVQFTWWRSMASAASLRLTITWRRPNNATRITSVTTLRP